MCVISACFGYAETLGESLPQNWRIGGKIYFEEQSSIDSIGTMEMNAFTRKAIKDHFDIQMESCAHNAKVLLKKENDQMMLTHREESSKRGIGEEMHATLLYTSKRFENALQTLRDIYDNLREVDAQLPQDHAPTVQQVAEAYQKILQPDWKFQIVGVEFVSGKSKNGANVNCIVSKLQFEGKEEIMNAEGHSISCNFLHVTLANIDASVASESDKIQLIVSDLKEKLSGKWLKIGNRNGQADLEFGISGSKDRVRPSLGNEEMRKNNQEKFSALRRLNLPRKHYAITGSGPLGIRNIRAIGDIDIIVSQELWKELAAKYNIIDLHGVKKISLPGGIEAFHEGSFYAKHVDPTIPTVASRIARAEIIDDLPFDSLEIILYYKRKDLREKDLKDIGLIEQWMSRHKN
jgi:hypothetical protein